MEEIYPTDRGGGCLPCAQERTVDPSNLSLAREPGQGACAGSLSGLRFMGDPQTPPCSQESEGVSHQSVVNASGLRSADIVLPTTDRREIRLRRITTPTQEQEKLINQLGMYLPERLDFDYECSADSETG
jgi:hypothetical protein